MIEITDLLTFTGGGGGCGRPDRPGTGSGAAFPLLPSPARCCKSRFARWQMTRRRQVR